MSRSLDITPIPAFDDNYIWLLRNPGGVAAAVVDPGDEEPVLEVLGRQGLELLRDPDHPPSR